MTDEHGNNFQAMIQSVREHGQAGGLSENQMAMEIAYQKDIIRRGQLANRGWQLAGNRTASEKYSEDQASIAQWQEDVGRGRPDEEIQLARMRKQANKEHLANLGIRDPQEEYADQLAELMKARGTVSQDKLQRAAAAAADAMTAAMDEPFMTAFEKFNAHMNDIDDREREGAYTHDQAQRRRLAETEGELAHAGIRRPEEEFKKAFQEITDLLGSGDITQKEFDRRRRELEAQGIGGLTSDVHSTSPVAAMAAGSREAYSLLVRSQLGDQKDKLASEANAILKRIESNTKPSNAPKGKVLN